MRKKLSVVINGRPISALGSSLVMRLNSDRPSPSDLKLPAQSKGCSCLRYASISAVVSALNSTSVVITSLSKADPLRTHTPV